MLLLLKMSTGIIGLYIFIYYYRYSYVPWTTKFANPILRIFLVFSPLLLIMLPYAAAGGTALIMSGDMTYFEFLKEFLELWFGFYTDWG